MGKVPGVCYPLGMFTALILLAAAIWIPGTILLIVHARLAPVGIEDEHGFRVVTSQPARVIEFAPHSESHAA